MRRRLTKEKQLEIENAALREAIESALADLEVYPGRREPQGKRQGSEIY